MRRGVIPKNAFAEYCRGVDYMLAAIENDENPLLGQKRTYVRFRDKSWNSAIEGRRDGAGDVSGICKSSQIDEIN
jgi:hypothetical protein